MSQGRNEFKGDAWCQQDFLCKPVGWSGFSCCLGAFPQPPFTHKQLICLLRIILFSLAAFLPELYLFVSLVLITRES